MTRVLILGANGQVGWELQRSMAPLAEVIGCDRSACDLANPSQLRQTIREIRPDIVINAAAYVSVDKAESEIAQATAINATAVDLIAEETAKLGGWLIHYSTDYVFDGTLETPYSEDAPTCPLNVYGKTKLKGECAIRNREGNYLILRTSWVYSARGTNFIKTILRLAMDRDALGIVADQYGVPTSASLIADVTAHLTRCLHVRARVESGVYHLVPNGRTTWYDYAQLVIGEAIKQGWPLKVRPENVKAITTEQYPVPAKRPANSCLCNEKLQRDFDLTLPFWQPQVIRVVKELSDTRIS